MKKIYRAPKINVKEVNLNSLLSSSAAHAHLEQEEYEDSTANQLAATRVGQHATTRAFWFAEDER